MQDIQKKKFESIESTTDASDAYELSSQSFNLLENSMSGLGEGDKGKN
jgi:hypothetical protein